MSEPKPDGKPFAISKRLVWEAWRRVKANRVGNRLYRYSTSAGHSQHPVGHHAQVH